MAERPTPPLFVDAATVERHLPDAASAIALATVVLGTLGSPRHRPVKASLASASSGTFAQVMAARLDSGDTPDERPLLGMKWIAGNAGNRARGLPAMSSLVVLNDPDSGLPLAILDGSPITACRTAALSGAAIRILSRADAMPRTALVLGAGVQGRAHLDVLAACGVTMAWVHDRHPDRSRALAADARSDGLHVVAVDDPTTHIGQADVLVSATSLAGGVAWVGVAEVSPDAIVVPVDYAAQVTGELVSAAGMFAVDDRGSFDENHARGRLSGWPEPAETLGNLAGRHAGHESWTRPPGVAVALHQGPALADVMFADAVLRSALASADVTRGSDDPR